MTYHNYIFFTLRSSFQKLPEIKKNSYKKAFLKTLQKENKIITYTYATLGLKANTTFLLWLQSDNIDTTQNYLNELMHTDLGKYLKITYTLFGMTRPTQYSSSINKHTVTSRKGGAFLVIYPFTKTHEWYKLTFEKRKELMAGHISVGRKYPQITQLLLYSYGVDDQEFIVSYETDDLSDFQSLVIELRSDAVREYTLNDTPIFTCIYKPLEEMINFI
jgi:chlorite dismutase